MCVGNTAGALALTNFLFPWCCGDKEGTCVEGNRVTGVWFENTLTSLTVSMHGHLCLYRNWEFTMSFDLGKTWKIYKFFSFVCIISVAGLQPCYYHVEGLCTIFMKYWSISTSPVEDSFPQLCCCENLKTLSHWMSCYFVNIQSCSF